MSVEAHTRTDGLGSINEQMGAGSRQASPPGLVLRYGVLEIQAKKWQRSETRQPDAAVRQRP